MLGLQVAGLFMDLVVQRRGLDQPVAVEGGKNRILAG
jgi:hypothetical protein